MSKEYDYLFKLLVVGETGVGKSCLLLKYVEGSFTETFISTIGVDFKMKTVGINDKKVKLQIWDTAGQERYRTIVNSFYRGAHGILLCFDLTDVNSFLRVQHWLGEIGRLAPEGIPIVLAGTKSDLTKKRMVDNKEAVATAEKHHLKYVETSSKTGDNVDDVFATLAAEVLKVEVSKKPSPHPTPDGLIKPGTEGGQGGGGCC
eukprot:TRINITY_DN1990_c0_g1_i2.p1 TRINITY_DN1990_c0_g1~~TRINITY_DN1990_c0_g1_i2.p1  ORF type:complete len:203 (+),score=51.51 TRINITY_DN1990_c0_g1_i2:96-704(+)